MRRAWFLFAIVLVAVTFSAQTYVNSKGFTIDGATGALLATAAPVDPTYVNSQGLRIDATGAVVVALSGATGTGAVVTSFCNSAVGTSNGAVYMLFPFSKATASLACTSTTAQEMPVPVPCTFKNMYVKASAAGGAAGSGLMQLFKNGSASGITCTLGTGTSCNDTTHTVSMAVGDTYSVRVTTGQASDTTADIRAAFQCS